jgi:hypothetical protein
MHFWALVQTSLVEDLRWSIASVVCATQGPVPDCSSCELVLVLVLVRRLTVAAALLDTNQRRKSV